MITVNKRERKMSLRLGLKVASFSILVLLVLAVSLVVTLVYSDPTRLKDQVEALARQQGLELELVGDIGWSIYPNVQFVARGATAKYTASSMQLDAQIDYLNFALKPWPALRGELEFVGAEVSGAVLNLQVKEMEASEDGLEKSMEDASVLLPLTKIARLRFSDVRLNLRTENATDNSLESVSILIHNLDAEDLASDGDPFAVSAALQIESARLGLNELEFDGYLLVSPLTRTYAAEFHQLSVGLESDGFVSELTGDSRLNLDLGRDRWSAEANLADQGIASLRANYEGSLSEVDGSGRVELNLSDLGKWTQQLGVGGDQSLPIDVLALDADISLNETQVQLQNLRVRADENSGKGQVVVGLGDQKTLAANLDFDLLDLAPYLASTPATDSSVGQPTGRIDQFKQLSDFDIELNVDRLKFADREVENMHLLANLKQGVGDLFVPSALFAGGDLSLSFSVDLGAVDQISDIEMNITGLQLAELENTGQQASLGGILDLTYQGALRQPSQGQLVQGLQGSGRIGLNEFAVRNMNIEQTICETAELLGGTASATTSWPDSTVLGDIASDYVISGGNVTIDELGFVYGNMEVVGASDFSLVDLDYDLRFTVEVNDTKTSADGCNINRYAQGVPLPLQCTGSLGVDGQQSCGVDTNLAENLVFRQVGDRLIEGLLDQVVGDESNDEPEDTGQENIDEENSGEERDQLRSLLEGLLRSIDN